MLGGHGLPLLDMVEAVEHEILLQGLLKHTKLVIILLLHGRGLKWGQWLRLPRGHFIKQLG